jgi:hypothetical protein
MSFIETKHGFPHVVGTLIPLVSKPSMQGKYYFSKKMNYALIALVVLVVFNDKVFLFLQQVVTI